MCQDKPVSFTVGLGLDPNEGSTMGSDFGEVLYDVRCDEAFDPGQYPRELDATEHLQCDMVGVEPGSGEAVEAQRWGTDEVARFTSASEACCRCGGGHTVKDMGVENGGAGIMLETIELPVPAEGCKNGNQPVSLGDFELLASRDKLDELQ